MYAAFMDLEKAYDRVDREALWRVLKIYGVGGGQRRSGGEGGRSGGRKRKKVEDEKAERKIKIDRNSLINIMDS